MDKSIIYEMTIHNIAHGLNHELCLNRGLCGFAIPGPLVKCFFDFNTQVYNQFLSFVTKPKRKER